jgi:predicted ATPase
LTDALDYITIKGFKSIAALERLELRPINVVIGANGSGKSNFVGAFSFLGAIREGRLAEYVTRSGGAEKVLHFGSKTTQEISFGLSFVSEGLQYELKLAPTDNDGLFPMDEAVSSATASMTIGFFVRMVRILPRFCTIFARSTRVPTV